MNEAQWTWMQASVVLVGAAAAAMTPGGSQKPAAEEMLVLPDYTPQRL